MRGIKVNIIVGLMVLLFLSACGEEAGQGLKDLSVKILPAKAGHKAFWTGTEMIVWGGNCPESTSLCSPWVVLRYNPTADTWIPNTTMPVQTGLETLAVVWTGTEMIVFGRTSPTTGTLVGGRYNPTTDTWTTISTSNAPSYGSSVGLTTAVWTGTEMIVWSGFSSTGGPTGGRYNPATDTWKMVSTTNGPPLNCCAPPPAVWTGTEMIVWGGSSSTDGRYNPTTDTWASISTTNAPSSSGGLQSAVWTGTEMIVWTGSGFSGRYNPTTDTWSSISTLNDALGASTVVWTGKEMIVVGCCTFGSRYNPATNTWVKISGPNVSTNIGLAGAVAVWTGTEMIVWGGKAGSVPVRSGGRYNPTTDSWTRTSIIVGG